MKVKIEFKGERRKELPFNRKYAMSSWIYHCIKLHNPDYSESLHYEKNPKLFVFSDLYIPKPYRITKNGITPEGDEFFFFISSPVMDFVSNLVKGFLDDIEKTKLTLERCELTIQRIETLKEVDFSNSCKFKSLSPIVTSTFKNERVWYLKPHNSQFYENLEKNLKKKYKLLYGREFRGKIEIEPFYEVRWGVPEKAVKVKKGFVRGFKIPLEIRSNPKILKIAYDCGLGEKNSLGFGMVDVIDRGL